MYCHHSEIDRVRNTINAIHVFRKRLPAPGNTLVQRGTRNILNAFHQLNELIAISFANRRKSDATVSQHRRCNAEINGRPQSLVPANLTVVMRMKIDETGCHYCAGCIKDLIRHPYHADFYNFSVANTNVRRHRAQATTVI